MSDGVLFLLAITPLLAAEHSVDPTFLWRSLSGVSEKAMDISTPICHYKPLFGAGDTQAGIVTGVSRYGEIAVDPKAPASRLRMSATVCLTSQR